MFKQYTWQQLPTQSAYLFPVKWQNECGDFLWTNLWDIRFHYFFYWESNLLKGFRVLTVSFTKFFSHKSLIEYVYKVRCRNSSKQDSKACDQHFILGYIWFLLYAAQNTGTEALNHLGWKGPLRIIMAGYLPVDQVSQSPILT